MYNSETKKKDMKNVQKCNIKYQIEKIKTSIRILTKAVCKNIFSTIENRVLRLSFLYKIEIWKIFTLIIKRI